MFTGYLSVTGIYGDPSRSRRRVIGATLSDVDKFKAIAQVLPILAVRSGSDSGLEGGLTHVNTRLFYVAIGPWTVCRWYSRRP